jgi:hypothetical protein
MVVASLRSLSVFCCFHVFVCGYIFACGFFVCSQAVAEEQQPSFRAYYDRINARVLVVPPEHDNFDIEYQTYSNWVVGAAVQFGFLSIGFERSIPTSGDANKQRTAVTGVHAMADLDRWNVEAYWLGFDGFNVTDPGADLPADSPVPLTKRRDMRAYFAGLNGSFVKSPEDVGLAGRFDKLPEPGFGWSFVGHVRLAAVSLNTTQGLIPEASRDLFTDEQDIKGVDTRMLGGGPGVAASWIGGNLRLGLAVAMTLGYGHVNAHNGGRDDFDFAVNINSRLGTAYQMGDFEIGVFGVFDNDPGSTRYLNFQIDREVIQTYLRVQI